MVAFKGTLTILSCIVLIMLKERMLGSSTLPFPHLTGGNTHVLHSSSPDLHLGLMVRETEAQRAEATCLMSPVSNGQSTIETSPELML